MTLAVLNVCQEVEEALEAIVSQNITIHLSQTNEGEQTESRQTDKFISQISP